MFKKQCDHYDSYLSYISQYIVTTIKLYQRANDKNSHVRAYLLSVFVATLRLFLSTHYACVFSLPAKAFLHNDEYTRLATKNQISSTRAKSIHGIFLLISHRYLKMRKWKSFFVKLFLAEKSGNNNSFISWRRKIIACEWQKILFHRENEWPNLRFMSLPIDTYFFRCYIHPQITIFRSPCGWI